MKLPILTPLILGVADMKSKTVDTTFQELQKEFTPPFTVKDLRDSIPAHLFVRSTIKSFAYTLCDLVAVVVLGWIAVHYLDHPNLPLAAKFVLWPAYWIMQVSLACAFITIKIIIFDLFMVLIRTRTLTRVKT
jgi:predicted outer membrane lipoprotein